MTATLSRDDLTKLLKAVNPSNTTDPAPTSRDYVNRREDWLKAAATCARLLLHHPDDKADYYYPRNLSDLTASKLVAGYREQLTEHGVSVIGIHFLDKFVGRWSRMWVGKMLAAGRP